MQRPLFYWFCALPLLLASASASAQDWAATFTPSALRAQLPATQRALVIAAGPSAADVEPAAKALEAGLRTAGVGLVMSDDSLGDVSAPDDKALVDKAKPLPIDHIAIVRVFPGESATAANVVVVVYDKAGAVVVAFNGKAGEPLADPSISQGAQATAMDAVAKITKESEPAPDAQNKYDEKFVWFADIAAVQVNTGRVMATWTEPYRGKYKEPLEGRKFYDEVGRKDLGDQYASNLTVKRSLTWGGFTASMTGLILMFAGIPDTIPDCDYEDTYDLDKVCDEAKYGKIVAGGVLAGVGTIVSLVGVSKKPHPVEAPEARKLADEYNAKLRQDLGLEPEAAQARAQPRAPAKRPAASLALVPRASQREGSLTLRLQF